MTGLAKLFFKKNLRVIGCMTGTSADGLDLALCQVGRVGKYFHTRCLAAACYPFPVALQARLIRIAGREQLGKLELKQLEGELCRFYARKILLFISTNNIKSLDLIGSHGQTIFHRDGRLGTQTNPASFTWQIVDGGYLAALTGIPVVSDFRVNDVALGGSGAPLTPLCHYHLFGRPDRSIAVLNIGGISNLTYLPAGAVPENISASDCGPGNMIVDQLMKTLYGKAYDRSGRIALRGKISTALLDRLRRQGWYRRAHPKSLGREQFGAKYTAQILEIAGTLGLRKADIIASASELTVSAVDRYLRLFRLPAKLIVAGGGAHNNFFLKRLQEAFPQVEVSSSQALGIDPDYLEAVSFALLAAMYVQNHPANLPQITGATRVSTLGKLALP